MKINKIANLNNRTFLLRQNSQYCAERKTLTNTKKTLDGFANVTAPYSSINFTSTYEANNRKMFASAKRDFTPEADKIWEKATYIAKKYNHSEITEEHVFAAILYGLVEYIDKLNSTKGKYSSSIYATPEAFELFIGARNIFANETIRNIWKL